MLIEYKDCDHSIKKCIDFSNFIVPDCCWPCLQYYHIMSRRKMCYECKEYKLNTEIKFYKKPGQSIEHFICLECEKQDEK